MFGWPNPNTGWTNQSTRYIYLFIYFATIYTCYFINVFVKLVIYIRQKRLKKVTAARRAVPIGIWLGGEFKNLGPLPLRALPPNNFLRQRFVSENKTSQKIFQTLVLHNRGLNLVFQTFFDLIFPENSLIFKTFRNSSIPGPPLCKLSPLFLLLFGGCCTPPPHTHTQ